MAEDARAPHRQGRSEVTARRDPADEDEQVIIGAAQLILAEKRTALSVMRTGIGVFALPLGVLSLLVASSRYYRVGEVLHLFLPLLVLCVALVVLGVFLVVLSLVRLRHFDHVLRHLKGRHPLIGEYLE
jgi:uncharacterized membrane protein YidH (DUF202 family)